MRFAWLWWLNGGVPCGVDPDSPKAPRPALFVEMRASLSEAGSFGHMGMYSREVTPLEFVVCRKATPDEWKYLTERPSP